MPVYQLPRGWGVGGRWKRRGDSGERVKSMQSYSLFLWFMENYFELFSCREADVICSLRTGERERFDSKIVRKPLHCCFLRCFDLHTLYNLKCRMPEKS